MLLKKIRLAISRSYEPFSQSINYILILIFSFSRSAIQTSLERRGLNINNINIYVEASNTPLPLECESFLLGGNTLNIKGKTQAIHIHSLYRQYTSLLIQAIHILVFFLHWMYNGIWDLTIRDSLFNIDCNR